MTITKNSLHYRRIIDQILRNLTGLQFDIRFNAQNHRAMALAQSPGLVQLQGLIAAAVSEYRRRMGWLDTLVTTQDWPAIRTLFVTQGGSEAEVLTMVQEIRTAVNALDSASKSTYAQIVTACDTILSTIDAAPSLWPE